jgi:hypothetical protein
MPVNIYFQWAVMLVTLIGTARYRNTMRTNPHCFEIFMALFYVSNLDPKPGCKVCGSCEGVSVLKRGGG